MVAVEVNLSCPNLDGGSHLFAHDPAATAEVLRAVAGWACHVGQLSANTDRVVEVASAAQEASAEAVTLANTMLGMVIDVEASARSGRRRWRGLGAGHPPDRGEDGL